MADEDENTKRRDLKVSDIYEEIVDPAAWRRVLTFGQNAKAKNGTLVTEVETSYLGSKHSATELHPPLNGYSSLSAGWCKGCCLRGRAALTA